MAMAELVIFLLNASLSAAHVCFEELLGYAKGC